MANEATQISQPDSVPGPASTGYQAQNINIEAQRNGFDHTAPSSSSATQVTLPIGGPVDVNGVSYSITTNAVLTLSAADTDYYIHLVGTGTNLTPTLSTSSGTFDASKNARYNTSSERVLDWVVRRDSITSVLSISKIIDKSSPTAIDQSLRRDSSIEVDNGTFRKSTSGEVLKLISPRS